MLVKACLHKHIRDPYTEKLQEAIRPRFESHSMRVCNAAVALMHIARDMYRDVMDTKTVEVPEEFFDKTCIRHLMIGTRETSRRNARMYALHENFAKYRSNGTRYKGDADIYEYGAMKHHENLKNRMTVNLERFMIRAVSALDAGPSCRATKAIINGVANDSQNEDEIKFVGAKASNESTNEASVIRAVIGEHRAVLGLPNPAEKRSELKNIKERYDRLVVRYFVFLDRQLDPEADMEHGVEANEESLKRWATLMGKRFNVVPLCIIKFHFGTIDAGVLYGIMKEICPGVRCKEDRVHR